MDRSIQTLLHKLHTNNLSATYVPDRHAACDLVLFLIPKGTVVGCGSLCDLTPRFGK